MANQENSQVIKRFVQIVKNHISSLNTALFFFSYRQNTENLSVVYM